jgi:hypothetical protein
MSASRALESWIGQVIAGQADPRHRQALRGYTLWHHLRRLRGRLAAAAAFLDWLTEHRLTLGTCTQADLDQWLAGTSSHLVRSAKFVRWAVARRHACGLTAPATRWPGPSGPPDQDRRWADARRLLHDGTYPPADRIAGPLYAQKLSVITTLTTQQVQHEDGRVLLRLGSRPVVLPRLDDLVAGLAAGRRRRAAACSASLPLALPRTLPRKGWLAALPPCRRPVGPDQRPPRASPSDSIGALPLRAP